MQAFVLHSGGIDSTTALALAIRDHGAGNVFTVQIDYGQRHLKEIVQAQLIAKYYGVQHRTIKLGPQPSSMLTDAGAEIPKASYAELPQGISPTYVPFRNGQMLSAVAAWAHDWCKQALKPCDEGFEFETESSAVIYFGAHAEDAANWAYPDCTPEFVGAMANAIFIGTYQRVRLVTPFLHMSKAEIIQLGQDLSVIDYLHGDNKNVPYELTWSCYKGEQKHCGECPTCLARKAAFAKSAVYDVTEYAA